MAREDVRGASKEGESVKMLIDLKNDTKDCGQDKGIQTKTAHAIIMWERCPP